MKTNVVRLCLLFALLSVAPQTPLVTAATPQNANSSTTVVQPTPAKATCAGKCRATYDRCRHRHKKDVKNKCVIAYRNCLRRCPLPKDVE
jgi:hypothetical protein